MFKISENANNNYLAKVVQLEKSRKHENADRLQCWTINFQNVITNLDYAEGDIVVYFPVECAINKDLISFINGFEDKTLNKNSEKSGFFNKHARVRAIRLRGEASQGFVLPISEIFAWYGSTFLYDIDQEFDFIEGIEICRKYIPTGTKRTYLNKGKQAVKRISRLVENQFRLHNDTNNLRKHIDKIHPDDYIGLHYKKHGTSWVIGNVLCRKKLKWHEKLAKSVGINIKDTEYDIIYSSRKVVKNQYETRNANDYYGYDLWANIKDEVKNSVPKGYTLYGEAVGYTESGGFIQDGYDYGCPLGKFDIWVYRITITNEDGFVIDLDDRQIEEFCNNYGLNYKNTFIYYGKARDLYPELDIHSHWHEDFIKNLERDYNNKDCYMCTNPVPEEGIVLRKQKFFHYEAYKLKSTRFLERETEELDKGIENIEDQVCNQ